METTLYINPDGANLRGGDNVGERTTPVIFDHTPEAIECFPARKLCKGAIKESTI